MAKKPASVITSTSRLATWVSSCAITPSSSAGESSSMIPVVAQTVAFLGERPIANAFGMRVSATATFGLGRSAWMHRRSIIACSSGASRRRDLAGAHRAQGELVGAEQLERREAAGDDRDRHPVRAGGEQRHDQDDVDEAEQEHGEGHPDLEPGVLAE